MNESATTTTHPAPADSMAADAIPAHFKRLRDFLNSQILGQSALVERLLVALLADGHLLVEGAPGLAKTRAIKALADGIQADFHRVQFTPDLLPGDLTGSEIYRSETGKFEFQRGPIFHNLVLADEINRAPAKVQSALLEAMAEHQITVGAKSHALPPLFLVMATQNPIEQEGTYPLPEAQLDRFMLHVRVGYPDKSASGAILAISRAEAQQLHSAPDIAQRIPQQAIFAAREQLQSLYMAEPVERYLIELVEATRNPAPYDAELARWVAWGASPRALIALDRGARALAWLDDRDFVTPEDVQRIAPDVLRHRVLLGFEAQADGVDAEAFVARLLRVVPAV